MESDAGAPAHMDHSVCSAMMLHNAAIQNVKLALYMLGGVSQVHEGADAWGHPIAQTGIVSNLSKPLAVRNWSLDTGSWKLGPGTFEPLLRWHQPLWRT